MNEESEGDNQIFTFDISDPRIQLAGLESTAKLLTIELLESWLKDFVEREKYEEAAIIKQEIDRRQPKYKFYLVEPDGKQTEVRSVGNPNLNTKP